MKIICDARRVVVLSYSCWAQVLGLAVLILPELAFGIWGVEFDPYVLWWIGVLLLLFGTIGRLVVQSRSTVVNALRIASVALLILGASVLAAGAQPAREADTLAVAVPFIAEREGMRLVAYHDIVGVPTICAGSTRGVTMGMRKTLAECTAPPWRDAAFTSLAYNIGISAAGGSTAVRRLNGANVRGACDAITWWNRAGQRVVRGLVLRRAAERDMCMVGVS